MGSRGRRALEMRFDRVDRARSVRPRLGRARERGGHAQGNGVDAAVLEIVACPLDQTSLASDQGRTEMTKGHAYPVVDGIPVLLDPGVEPTLPDVFASTVRLVESGTTPLVDNVGAESFVAQWIIRTNGNLYRGIDRLAPPLSDPGAPDRAEGVGFLWTSAATGGGGRSRRRERALGLWSSIPTSRPCSSGVTSRRRLDLDVRYVVGDARTSAVTPSERRHGLLVLCPPALLEGSGRNGTPRDRPRARASRAKRGADAERVRDTSGDEPSASARRRLDQSVPGPVLDSRGAGTTRRTGGRTVHTRGRRVLLPERSPGGPRPPYPLCCRDRGGFEASDTAHEGARAPLAPRLRRQRMAVVGTLLTLPCRCRSIAHQCLRHPPHLLRANPASTGAP